MTKTLYVIFLGLAVPNCAFSGPQCDCTSYPFKPNPPCFSVCVAKIAKSKQGGDLLKVKNIDPGVFVALDVLSKSKDLERIDFSSINKKSDLERAALTVLKVDRNKHE